MAVVIEGPVRMCIGCRKSGSISELFRVAIDMQSSDILDAGTVKGPVTRLIVDHKRVLTGRGAWLHSDAKCLGLAEKKNAFSRSLRTQGEIDTTHVSSYADSGFGQVGKI